MTGVQTCALPIFVSFYKYGLLYSQTGFVATGVSDYEKFTDIIDFNGTTNYLEVFAANVARDTSDISGASFFECHLVWWNGYTLVKKQIPLLGEQNENSQND